MNGRRPLFTEILSPCPALCLLQTYWLLSFDVELETEFLGEGLTELQGELELELELELEQDCFLLNPTHIIGLV